MQGLTTLDLLPKKKFKKILKNGVFKGIQKQQQGNVNYDEHRKHQNLVQNILLAND